MTTTALPAGRPRALLGMRGLATMLRIDAKLWIRDPGAAFFGLAFPTVLLVGMGLAVPGMREVISEVPPHSAYYGVPMIAWMVPPILAIAAATPALNIVPVTLATQREQGVLKRLSTTPMRPQGVFVTSYLINLAAVLVSAATAVGLAMTLFDIPTPRRPLLVLAGFVLGLAAIFAVGTLIAARAPKGTTASAIGTSVYFPMMLFAGLWTPGPAMPGVLATIARFTPMGAAAQTMQAGWYEGSFPWVQLLVMVAWTAILMPISLRIFRWS